ncbi:MAG: hypothetical protein ACKV2T_17365 [Kofleriaceae bacterium]
MDWDAISEQLRELAERGVGWEDVQGSLHAELVRLARRQPIGRLRDDRDAAHEIATRVLERMHANEFRAVKRLFATEKAPVVRAWIHVLVRTAAVDVMRAHAEYQRGSASRAPGWVSLASLASSPGSPAPSSLVEKQRDLERFIERAIAEATAAVNDHAGDAPELLATRWQVEPIQAKRLVAKGSRYLPVLRLVLAGHSYPEVASVLSLTRREVELVVGYLEQFLQARGFGKPA